MTGPILPDATSRLAIATSYLRRGWAVFVLGAGKTPLPNCPACATAGPEHDKERCDCLVCHGFYAATKDQSRLELMLMLHPEGHLALRTGFESGLFVIDFESTDDGLQTLDEWEAWTNSSLPNDTLRARSASGGVHVFLEYILPVRSRNRVLPGTDIKGDGGYVLVPQGQDDRVWLNDNPIKQPSLQLIDWLDNARQHGRGAAAGFGVGYDFQEFVRHGCPDGHRDEFFNDMCFRMRKSGLGREDAEPEIRKHWERAAQPPVAKYFMPWEHVLYKITRVWRTVEPDAPVPDWRPNMAAQEGDAGTIVVTEHPTDTGNAQRLLRLVGGDFRFVPETRRWMVWDGSRWTVDKLNQITSRTMAVIEDLRRTAELEQDAEAARRWASWALSSESIRSRTSMVRAAEVHPDAMTYVTEFDQDPLQLVVINGTLDLRTGKLRESRRDDLNTRRADVTYDKSAECPRWRSHVKLITNGDAVLASYLRRAVGYTLTGLVGEQVFFMLEGDGDNGKNVFVDTIRLIMGDYAQVGTSALLTGGDEQHPTILADLVGARLVFVDEARQGRPLNVERVKQLTGGSKIKARRMGQDFFEFDAQLKLWIAGNNHPTMRDPSSGVWRRLHRVMFTAKIPKDKKTKDYHLILFEEEAAGILNWAIEGLKDWRQLNGLGVPPAITESVDELRQEEDFVGQFIDERVTRTGDSADVIGNAELYSEFCIWATLVGIPMHERPNRTHFGRSMSSHGFTKWKGTLGGSTQRGFSGLKIWRT